MFLFLQTSPRLFFMSCDNREYFRSRNFNEAFSVFSILVQSVLTARLPLKLFDDKLIENIFGITSERISRHASFSLHSLRLSVLNFPIPFSSIAVTRVFILSGLKSLLWRSMFSIRFTKLEI